MKFSGEVLKGNGFGRQINFPTANLKLDGITLEKGVYLSSTIYNGKKYDSISNFGNHPTYKELINPILETHILDFDEEIYGKIIEVELIKFIRPEIKFNDVIELKNQIQKDIEIAKKLIK